MKPCACGCNDMTMRTGELVGRQLSIIVSWKLGCLSLSFITRMLSASWRCTGSPSMLFSLYICMREGLFSDTWGATWLSWQETRSGWHCCHLHDGTRYFFCHQLVDLCLYCHRTFFYLVCGWYFQLWFTFFKEPSSIKNIGSPAIYQLCISLTCKDIMQVHVKQKCMQ